MESAMLARPTRPLAVLTLLAGVAAFSLAGCNTIQRETGLNTQTQTSAAAGGAVGGVIAALADANPAWIAASVILGGVTGGVIGNYLGKQDAEKGATNNLNALDQLGPGQTASWRDASTGNYGSTTVHSAYTNSSGDLCKTFSETIHTSRKDASEQGTACRPTGGSWTVQRS